MQSVTITVRAVRNGAMRCNYPMCELAKKFALIAGTKTLTENTLRLIRDLGYEVKIIEQAEGGGL